MSEWHLSNYREAELRKFLEILPFWLYYYTNRYTHNQTYTHLYTHTHTHTYTHTAQMSWKRSCVLWLYALPSPQHFCAAVNKAASFFHSLRERGEVVWIFIHSQRDSKNISKVNELQWNDSIVQELRNHNCIVILCCQESLFKRKILRSEKEFFPIFTLRYLKN